MLRTAAEQGITDVVNTIHYQHPKMDDYSITNDELRIKIQELQVAVDKAGISIKLHQGAEVFYLPNLVEIARDPVTTIGNGKYMLVEFQVYQLPEGYREVLFNLVMSGVTPIIAHPERYKPIQRDIDIIRDLIHADCLIQIDGGSLTGSLGQSAKKAAVDILRQGLCHLIGSDAHDDKRRNFCLMKVIEIGRGLIGDSIDTIVRDNPMKLLNGEPIDTEIAVRAPVVNLSLLDKFMLRVFGNTSA